VVPQLFHLLQGPYRTWGAWKCTPPPSCGKSGMGIPSCKPLILIIGSSKLGIEADFHPMLKAYVNLGYQRECSISCLTAHHAYLSLRERVHHGRHRRGHAHGVELGGASWWEFYSSPQMRHLTWIVSAVSNWKFTQLPQVRTLVDIF
jgi:hypothetical protein